eukprot:9920319-Lingulodinium_polyedra.AAC.1
MPTVACRSFQRRLRVNPMELRRPSKWKPRDASSRPACSSSCTGSRASRKQAAAARRVSSTVSVSPPRNT